MFRKRIGDQSESKIDSEKIPVIAILVNLYALTPIVRCQRAQDSQREYEQAKK